MFCFTFLHFPQHLTCKTTITANKHTPTKNGRAHPPTLSRNAATRARMEYAEGRLKPSSTTPPLTCPSTTPRVRARIISGWGTKLERVKIGGGGGEESRRGLGETNMDVTRVYDSRKEGKVRVSAYCILFTFLSITFNFPAQITGAHHSAGRSGQAWVKGVCPSPPRYLLLYVYRFYRAEDSAFSYD